MLFGIGLFEKSQKVFQGISVEYEYEKHL